MTYHVSPATPSCICGQAPNTDLGVLRSGPLEIGDIISTEKNIYAPIYEFLAGQAGESCSQAPMTKPHQSMVSTLKTEGRRMGDPKFRPCLIFEEGKRGSNQVFVHLMASFESSEAVPKVFERFMAEVSTRGPNDHHKHLHTSPEWPSNSRQWIMTLPTSIQSFNLSRWQKSGRTGYHFSDTTIDQFREIINEQMNTWNVDVESDPNFLQQYRKEFIQEHKVTSSSVVAVLVLIRLSPWLETQNNIQLKYHCTRIDKASQQTF